MPTMHVDLSHTMTDEQRGRQQIGRSPDKPALNSQQLCEGSLSN